MFQLNRKKISIDSDLTIGDGAAAITYPAASLRSADTRASLGIVEVPDQIRPDDSRCWVTEDESGAYTAILKENALSDEITALIRRIDVDADTIYTAALGQRATEYAQAEAEAQAFKDGGYSGDVPIYVQAWAGATGNTAQWAADDILSTATAWRTAQASIRANRLARKTEAREAADFDALTAIKAAWETFLVAIRAQLGMAS